MKKLLLILFLVAMTASRIMAQDRVVTGTVTESNGSPVTSASVLIKGSTRGTATDANGAFKLSVPADARTLVISGVNLQTLEVSIGKKTDLGTIVLQASSKSLNEVVVVAYGTSSRNAITGSVATISGAQLADKPFPSVDKTLQGAVPGMQVASTSGAPGSSTAIRIRGIGSISAGASPLWVVDGAIINSSDITVNTTTANPLSALNPDDIESITVLKDAASTAVYGSRAANGVILVTTKKGKAGKTHLNLVAEVGALSDAWHPSNKPVNTTQAQTLLRQAVINAGEATDIPSADAFLVDPNGYALPTDYASHYTNWHDVVTRTGNQSQLNANLSGGNEKTQFYASAGFFNQDGTTIATGFKRYNGAFSINHKASDIFNFSATLNGSTVSQHTPGNGGLFNNPVGAYFFLPAWYTPYNADGSFKYNDDNGEFPLGGGSGWNPLIVAAWDKNTMTQTSFKGNVAGEAKILPNLKFTSRYAAEYLDIMENVYQNPFYGDGYSYGGSGAADYSRVFNYTWSNFLDFKQTLNADKDFYFDLKPGYEAYSYNIYQLQTTANVFPLTRALTSLSVAATPTQAFTLPASNASNSYFAIGDINYKDKYVFNASYRRDGSSVFGANTRYGSFYSIGGSWNIQEESFIKENTPNISLLKLRTSYGETGNSIGFGNYTPQAYYSFGSGSGYSYNYMGQVGSALTNAGYPNLTWEKNKIFNAALDFGLWRDRLTGTVEWYTRTTSNLLLAVPYSYTSGLINPATGGPTQNENVGSMKNQGIEFSITGKPVVSRDFNWTISFNIAHNKNRVTALYNNKPIPSANGLFNYSVGYDLLTYNLRQWAGANPDDGTPLWYTDATHKATTGSYGGAALSLKYSAAPKVFGSLSNTFNYKGISLDAQFFYNFGNYVYDTWGLYTNSDGLYTGNTGQLTKQLRAWQKPGDKTDVPQIIDGGNNGSYRASTRYLYKGDYIRLRNIQLGYTLPAGLVQKAHIGSLTIYVRGTNLLTFGVTKDLPFDPESGIFSSGSGNAGNLDVYIPKTITGGIKIGF